MTAPDPVPGRPTQHPWHSAAPPLALADESRTTLRGTRAGIVTRVLANAIDLVVVALAVVAGYAAVVAIRFVLTPTHFTWPSPASGTALAILLCTQAVYFMVTWAAFGATYGDRVLALAVTDGSGARLRWGRSAVRAVLCAIFPIGLAWVLVSRENRSVQDLLLGTAVVYDGRPEPAAG